MKEGIDGIWKAAERCGQSDPVMPRPFSTRPFKRSWTITNVVRPLSRLGTGPATEGQRHGLTPTKSNNTPLTDPFGGGHRGQGQRPRWPLISRHVWTRPHTMRGLKLVIRICGDEGGQEGSELLFASVCMLLAWWPGQWTSDHRTFAETPSLPPPDVQLLSQVSLLQGQEGGITPGMIPYYWACLPFRLGLVLLAGFGLILLVVLPPVSWSLWCPHTLTTRLQQFPVYPCTNLPGLCVRDTQHRGWNWIIILYMRWNFGFYYNAIIHRTCWQEVILQ